MRIRAANAKPNFDPEIVAGADDQASGWLERMDGVTACTKRALHGLPYREVVPPYLARCRVINEIGPLARFFQRAEVMEVAAFFLIGLIAHDDVHVAWHLRVRAETPAHGTPSATSQALQRIVRTKRVHKN